MIEEWKEFTSVVIDSSSKEDFIDWIWLKIIPLEESNSSVSNRSTRLESTWCLQYRLLHLLKRKVFYYIPLEYFDLTRRIKSKNRSDLVLRSFLSMTSTKNRWKGIVFVYCSTTNDWNVPTARLDTKQTRMRREIKTISTTRIERLLLFFGWRNRDDHVKDPSKKEKSPIYRSIQFRFLT